MRDNLEKIFKEKLESFEADFDNSAWNAMEERLDKSAQGGQGGGSSLIYWMAAVIATALLVGAAVYLLNDDNTDNTIALNKQVEAEKIVEPEEESVRAIELDETTEIKPAVEKNATEEVSVISNQTETPTIHEDEKLTPNIKTVKSKDSYVETNHKTGKEIPSKKDDTKELKEPLPYKSIDAPIIDEEVDTPVKKPAKRRFISGVVEQKPIASNIVTLCSGEPLIIKNPSQDKETVRVAYDNQEIDIPAGQYTQLSLTNTSTIYFLNEESEVIHEQEVIVNAKPQVDFTYEANVYEDGLPVVKLESFGDFEKTSWQIDDHEIISSGSAPTVNLFEKGSYEVTLNVTNENGCSVNKTRTITINDNYNLMAVSAFRPNDADPRNRTFMPFSLTQRSVQFVLTIIDPKDNGVVFTTKDPSQPWDGTDQRTGKMTPKEKTYMWKVQLENPLPNERAVYVGTILHH